MGKGFYGERLGGHDDIPPFVLYSWDIRTLTEKIFCFADDHREEGFGDYSRILYDHGIAWSKGSMREADVSALDGKTNRKADFRTVICLMEQGVPRYFEGRVDGVILTERYGSEGFGYDPVFMPDRFAVSFAEMPLDVKNQISHRGRAVKLLVDYLKTLDM